MLRERAALATVRPASFASRRVVTKLLLVEDHDELSDFLSRRLRRRGFEVVLARDGPEALRLAESEAPDLMLLDMNLPLMDGWTVATTLRERSDTLPIIALTAHAMSGDRAKALAAGCDEHHPKPVDFDLLLAQIDETLLRREELEG